MCFKLVNVLSPTQQYVDSYRSYLNTVKSSQIKYFTCGVLSKCKNRFGFATENQISTKKDKNIEFKLLQIKHKINKIPYATYT